MKTVKEYLDSNKCDCGEGIVIVDYGWNADPHNYDGWAEVMCPACGFRMGRWSGKKLKEGEMENVRLRFKA
jgi:hypothetical protein